MARDARWLSSAWAGANSRAAALQALCEGDFGLTTACDWPSTADTCVSVELLHSQASSSSKTSHVVPSYSGLRAALLQRRVQSSEAFRAVQLQAQPKGCWPDLAVRKPKHSCHLCGCCPRVLALSIEQRDAVWLCPLPRSAALSTR